MNSMKTIEIDHLIFGIDFSRHCQVCGAQTIAREIRREGETSLICHSPDWQRAACDFKQ